MWHATLFGGMFLTNPVKKGRPTGEGVWANFVPQFQGGLDLPMLTAPMPNPFDDTTALKAFEDAVVLQGIGHGRRGQLAG